LATHCATGSTRNSDEDDVTDPKCLVGKRALVTGAAGVVGRMIFETLQEAGARVALTDVRADALTALADEIDGGPDTIVRAVDLTQEAAIAGLVDEIGARWGSLDVLVNNAGIYPSGFLLDISPADWDRVFDVNLRAPFVLTQLVAKQMIAGGIEGSVINISSGGSRKMRLTAAPYCISKTALDRLTKGFAQELAPFHIRVNALEPGFAPGSVVSHLTDEHIAATAESIPLGRNMSREDIAGPLLFLASEASRYVTGATVTADGGNSIGSLAVYQTKKKPL
jgi:3-oxoacyl-[acyl-carrier protein] reductase